MLSNGASNTSVHDLRKFTELTLAKLAKVPCETCGSCETHRRFLEFLVESGVTHIQCKVAARGYFGNAGSENGDFLLISGVFFLNNLVMHSIAAVASGRKGKNSAATGLPLLQNGVH